MDSKIEKVKEILRRYHGWSEEVYAIDAKQIIDVLYNQPKQNYTLNCEKCGTPYSSSKGFPRLQWCPKCQPVSDTDDLLLTAKDLDYPCDKCYKRNDLNKDCQNYTCTKYYFYIWGLNKAKAQLAKATEHYESRIAHLQNIVEGERAKTLKKVGEWKSVPDKRGTWWVSPFIEGKYVSPHILSVLDFERADRGLEVQYDRHSCVPVRQFVEEYYPHAKWLFIPEPPIDQLKQGKLEK